MPQEIDDLVEKNGRVPGTLLGVDGNAFAIIGYTLGQLSKSDWSREDTTKVENLAVNAGTYENVIATCAAVLTMELGCRYDDGN